MFVLLLYAHLKEKAKRIILGGNRARDRWIRSRERYPLLFAELLSFVIYSIGIGVNVV